MVTPDFITTLAVFYKTDSASYDNLSAKFLLNFASFLTFVMMLMTGFTSCMNLVVSGASDNYLAGSSACAAGCSSTCAAGCSAIVDGSADGGASTICASFYSPVPGSFSGEVFSGVEPV